MADLVEFPAYSGMRIKSEALWVKWGDVDWARKEIIVRGDPVTATKNGEIRRVPIIKDMENLLIRLKDQLGVVKTERVLQVGRGYEAKRGLRARTRRINCGDCASRVPAQKSFSTVL